MPLVREDRRFFIGEIHEEKSQMKRYLSIHIDMILLPSREIKMRDQRLFKKQAV